MAESNLQMVLSVLAAIRAQDADMALQYVDRKFIQHVPYVADGVEGLRQYILDSSLDDLQMSVVRIIEDGPLVVAQLRSETSGEHMFTVYRFQEGLIAEHWAFSSPDAPPNKSGHTPLDGPAEPRHLVDTARNKALVRRYYETFHLAGKHERTDEFFTDDRMIRHEPGVRDGLSEFLRDVSALMQHRSIDEVKLLAGQGDLVFVAAKGTHEGAACVYIDLYRVEDDKVVEHWGFPQNVPPQSEWNHSNSML